MWPSRETKHLNCYCSNATIQTLEIFVQYSAFHTSFLSLSLSLSLCFSPPSYVRRGLEVPIHIYFLPPERPMDHINSRRTHDILELYWYTGGPYSPQLQYFFLWLYLSIWSTRKICTLHWWRVEMKCCTHCQNTQQATICSRRLSYWHAVILCGP